MKNSKSPNTTGIRNSEAKEQIDNLLKEANRISQKQSTEQQKQNFIQQAQSMNAHVELGNSPYDNAEDRSIISQILLNILTPLKKVDQSQNTSTAREEYVQYVEQKILHEKEQPISGEFKKTLEKIARLTRHNKNKYYQATCFISYAWPLEEFESEQWIQPYLITLWQDLNSAGIATFIDQGASRYGRNTASYMQEKIETSTYILVIGTRSLAKKHLLGTHAICNELNLIKDRLAKASPKDSLDKRYPPVIPIILTGDINSSLPAYFKTYTAIESFLGKSYLENLKGLIAHFYRTEPDNEELLKIWQELEISTKKSEYSSILAGRLMKLEGTFLSPEHDEKKESSSTPLDGSVSFFPLAQLNQSTAEGEENQDDKDSDIKQSIENKLIAACKKGDKREIIDLIKIPPLLNEESQAIKLTFRYLVWNLNWELLKFFNETFDFSTKFFLECVEYNIEKYGSITPELIPVDQLTIKHLHEMYLNKDGRESIFADWFWLISGCQINYWKNITITNKSIKISTRANHEFLFDSSGKKIIQMVTGHDKVSLIWVGLISQYSLYRRYQIFISSYVTQKSKLPEPRFSFKDEGDSPEKTYPAKHNLEEEKSGLQENLISACEQGSLEKAQLLIMQGANPFIPGKNGQIPLGAALWSLNHEMVAYLLKLSFATKEQQYSYIRYCLLLNKKIYGRSLPEFKETKELSLDDLGGEYLIGKERNMVFANWLILAIKNPYGYWQQIISEEKDYKIADAQVAGKWYYQTGQETLMKLLAQPGVKGAVWGALMSQYFFCQMQLKHLSSISSDTHPLVGFPTFTLSSPDRREEIKSSPSTTSSSSSSTTTSSINVSDAIQDNLVNACEAGNIYEVHALISKGASITVPNSAGKIPFGAAIWGLNSDLIDYFYYSLPITDELIETIRQNNIKHYGNIIPEFKDPFELTLNDLVFGYLNENGRNMVFSDWLWVKNGCNYTSWEGLTLQVGETGWAHTRYGGKFTFEAAHTPLTRLANSFDIIGLTWGALLAQYNYAYHLSRQILAHFKVKPRKNSFVNFFPMHTLSPERNVTTHSGVISPRPITPTPGRTLLPAAPVIHQEVNEKEKGRGCCSCQ